MKSLKKKEPSYQPFLHENPAKPVNGIQEIFNFIWSVHDKKYSETHPLSITPNWRWKKCSESPVPCAAHRSQAHGTGDKALFLNPH